MHCVSIRQQTPNIIHKPVNHDSNSLNPLISLTPVVLFNVIFETITAPSECECRPSA